MGTGTGIPVGTKELTRKQTCTCVAGMGTGTAKNTHGLPVTFTNDMYSLSQLEMISFG
jgi:hypothetical protein